MLFYGILILFNMILISVLNIVFGNFGHPWYDAVIAVCFFTVLVTLIHGITAGLIRKLPPKWFDKNKKFYQVSKRETRFYEKLGIKRWKDHIPELGGLSNFHKNKVQDPHNNEYVDRFILEINFGIWGHIIGGILGFLIILVDFGIYKNHQITYGLTIALPVAFIDLFCALLPTMVLRYNLLRLQTLYKANERKNRKNKSENQ